MSKRISTNKIDIIIPTYNRTNFLKRILDYYLPYGKDFNFIIADSSSRLNKSRNKKLIQAYSDLSILYLDKFSQDLQQHLKFAKMVKYAKSKYCVFCADDDFIVPNSIKECVDFLKKNPDYAAAHGTYIGFHIFQTLWGKKFAWKYRSTHHSLSSPTATQRLEDHLSNYTQMTWAVRRTDVVKKSYQEFAKAKIDRYLLPEYGEILPSVLTVIQGKVKRLNIFYSARQYFGSISSYYPSLLESRRVGIYDREYAKVKKSILKNLNPKTKTSKDRASLVIDRAMESYISFSYQEHLTNKINLLLSRYPKFILKKIRSLHALYLFTKDKTDKIGVVDDPLSKYYPDFMTIYHSIMRHQS